MSSDGLEKIDNICNKIKDAVKELEQAIVEEESKQMSEEEQWRRYWRQRELDRLRRQRSLPAGHDLPVLNSSHVAFSNSLRGGR
tara:strand:+ start:1099 stop:1350 length:252 start_codon:yes stop_codon:yes gene_type:complete